LSNEEKANDVYENFEKRGGSREKRGGGNEIHAPCACDKKEVLVLIGTCRCYQY
jgi:hypothetical protein